MNFLFGCALGLITALVFWIIIIKVIPKAVWDLIPEKYLWAKDIVIVAMFSLILVIIFYGNFAAYGPRVTIDSIDQNYYPERSEIEASDDIFNKGNKWDDFDDAVKEHEERQDSDIDEQ